MTLKALLDTLEDVPEAQRELYVERDGKFHFEGVDGLVPQEKLKEFRDNNIRLMKDMDELKKQMAGYANIDPEKYTSMQKQLEELGDQQMIDAGKLEEVLATRTERLRADYETQIKGYQKKIGDLETGHTKLTEELSRERIDGRLREVAPKIGIAKTGISDFIRRGREVWKLIEGEPVALQGEQPMYGKDPSQRISMEEWGMGLEPDAPHLFERSSGSGAQNQANGAARGARVIARGDPLAFGKNLEDIASGKMVVQ